jgi:transcriptional regulator with XRE-family HTH domain
MTRKKPGSTRRGALTEADALKACDLLLCLSTVEVAKKLGVSASSISRVLRGRAFPNSPKVQALVKKVREARTKEPTSQRCTKCGEERPRTEEFFMPRALPQKGLHAGWKKNFHSECRLCKSGRMKKRHQDARLEALLRYGGDPPQCACCGETVVEFLAVDHVNGGGGKHRRALHGRVSSIYLWLRQEGYPDGFRVLCHNCNSAMGYYGYCPHQKKVAVA